jgi:hypothetical protein
LEALAENAVVLESFFRFTAAGSLVGAGIELGPLSVSGTGSITGVLDVCADAPFTPPLNCAGTPGTGTVFAIDGADQLSESLSFPASSFFDVFVDLTIDGGGDGSAALTSATVALTTGDTVTVIPEPSTLFTMLVGLGALVLGRRRLR